MFANSRSAAARILEEAILVSANYRTTQMVPLLIPFHHALITIGSS